MEENAVFSEERKMGKELNRTFGRGNTGKGVGHGEQGGGFNSGSRANKW